MLHAALLKQLHINGSNQAINCVPNGCNMNKTLAYIKQQLFCGKKHFKKKTAHWADESFTDAFGEVLAIICKCS